MDRRQFLSRSGAALGSALPASAIASATVAPATTSMSWPDIRAQFALAPDRIHMSGFFLASHPRPVAAAIERHRRGLDLDPYGYLEGNVRAFEIAVRTAAARYTGADANDLAFTDSTSMGLGLVYCGLNLSRGQEILTDTRDHIVTHLATDSAARRSGATVRRVALYDQPAAADDNSIVETVARSLRPETRLLALTWVHSGTGVKLPAKRIAEVVAAHNRGRAADDRLLFALDGVHGFGLEDADIPALGCDIFIAGCHKWLLGPRGTGIVWARPDVWPQIAPTIPSFDSMWRAGGREAMPPAAWNTPGGFHSFEHRWALAEAFDFMTAIGRPRTAARVHELNSRCKEQLAKLDRVRVHTPRSPDRSAGIICFEVSGLTPAEVVQRLHTRHIVASTTPGFYKPAFARVAPSLLTDERDVDATVKAIASL